jgi:hypothetical protein
MNWKPIAANPDYAVSDTGLVKRVCNGRVRKPSPDKTGYFRVGLSLRGDGIPRSASVHRLVALAFIENPQGKPCVNHIDGNKQNNHASNLEWVTVGENWRHAIRTGLADPRRRTKIGPKARMEIKALAAQGMNTRDIAVRFGVGKACINRFLAGATFKQAA